MGQTSGGLPWPEDTDPVMAGAQAIRALAEAVEARPYYRAERQSSFSTAGNGSDVAIGSGGSAWETIESNFTPGDAAGFITPRAGIWRLVCRATLYAIVGGSAPFGCVAIATPSGMEIGVQFCAATGGGQWRQIANASGVVRLGVGETVRMSVFQNTGASQTWGSGPNRFRTRFSGEWLAA